MALFKGKKEEDKKATTEDTKKTSAKDASMKDLYNSEKKTKTDNKKMAKRGMAYKVLIKPLITEKAAAMSSENKYVFEVSKDANKIAIADAIYEVYGIKPTAVNISNMLGKKVRHGQTMGRRKDWKKAVVTLKKGSTIDVYEGV